MVWLRRAFPLFLALAAFTVVQAQGRPQQISAASQLAGPVNAVFPLAGEAIRKDLAGAVPAQSGWAIKGWVRIDRSSQASRTVVALVDRDGKALASIGLIDGRIFAAGSGGRAVSAHRAAPGEWVLVSLVATGEGASLKVGNAETVVAGIEHVGAPVALVFAPRAPGSVPFHGAVANFSMWQGANAAPLTMDWARPNEELIQFENGSPSWPQQIKQYLGLTSPQDPDTHPVSRSGEPAKFAANPSRPTAALVPTAPGEWTIGAWRFVAKPETSATPAAISRPGFDDRAWLPATVPGTVLTSYFENGVYPDPSFGLNNLLIPERLNKQDYWYRAEFVLPDQPGRQYRSINFEGINYASEVWVNGERLGNIKGAFIRGRFTLPASLGGGQRVAVAVRVSPPPHPGLPHEESLKAGPGQNGGAMMVDGPTFGATEGWDWIPSVRDRATGIWQDVKLTATGAARLGDPQVRTVLLKADNSLAELTVAIPVTNDGAQAVSVVVEAQLGSTLLTQAVELAPRARQVVTFDPSKFKELRIRNPELWWPNGYGKPTLHSLALTTRIGGQISDQRTIRYGMREISYELSLVNSDEALERVRVAPARAAGEKLIEIDHANIRKVEGGWALSLARETGSTPALSAAPDTPLAPHLVIQVNGVPIAVRGGNWGMDDWLKRVSRERLEPSFRLHRAANMNTIRNWMGQSTEEVFFQLADEYGMLVLNDFWLSTQDHNGEPGDTALFLRNAADTVSRFSHHPSIALWIGRNEGVPPPVLNRGLERLVREIDGTRAYVPNSRQVNMSNSGPWNYQPPEAYFTRLARGFSTEVGTPSFPTLDAFKAMMPAADQWPISDTWAYHDWHQGKAGDVTGFTKAMANRFGEPTDLVDFERKAQLINYESHRAIFEGMNDGLFTRNSGRLLWMSHPAWPSTMWQIYSSDYDTHAAFYGTMKGAEPVHVQLNLPDMTTAVVNSLAQPIAKGRVRIRNYRLDGTILSDQVIPVSAAALATTRSAVAVPRALFDRSPVVLTKLELFDARGRLLSENFYWLAGNPAAYRNMTAMKAAKVSIRTQAGKTGLQATLKNESSYPALMVKLTVRDATGARVLPAYWSDNYVSLLPGETRTVTLETPNSGGKAQWIGVGGWNVIETRTTIAR